MSFYVKALCASIMHILLFCSGTVPPMTVKGLNNNFTHLSYREVQSHIDNDKEKQEVKGKNKKERLM